MDNRVKYGTSFTQNKTYGKNGFKLDNLLICLFYFYFIFPSVLMHAFGKLEASFFKLF